MLRFRQEQVDAQERARISSFALRVAQFVHEQFEESRATPLNRLSREIEPIMLRARSHGMTTERNVASFVLTAAHLGSDFDTAVDPARHILQDRELSEDQKADRLEHLAIAVVHHLNRSAG